MMSGSVQSIFHSSAFSVFANDVETTVARKAAAAEIFSALSELPASAVRGPVRTAMIKAELAFKHERFHRGLDDRYCEVFELLQAVVASDRPCKSLAGFFVDWNGNTRKTDQPGSVFSCLVNEQFAHVDVVDSEGFVVHECTFFPTLEAVRAAGVVVNLVG